MEYQHNELDEMGIDADDLWKVISEIQKVIRVHVPPSAERDLIDDHVADIIK